MLILILAPEISITYCRPRLISCTEISISYAYFSMLLFHLHSISNLFYFRIVFFKMKAIAAILLILIVDLDAFRLTQIIENAEEEILQEMKEYNENKEPTRFYKSRKVTPE